MRKCLQIFFLVVVGLAHCQEQPSEAEEGFCDGDKVSCEATDDPSMMKSDDVITSTKKLENAIIKDAYDILRLNGYDRESDSANKTGRDGKIFSEIAQKAIQNAISLLALFGIVAPKVAAAPKLNPAIPKLVVNSKVGDVKVPILSLGDDVASLAETKVETKVDITTWFPTTSSRPPTPCNCNQTNYRPCNQGNGVCSSEETCSSSGGRAIGTCNDCEGCGVCCELVSRCQSNTDDMISYFKNPGFPQSDFSNNICQLTLNVREEVCQIRLDFNTFEMGSPVDGRCDDVDHLEIVNTALPDGVMGKDLNLLCGLNTGQHMYLPVKPNNVFILRAQGGRTASTDFMYDIKVTQIPCSPRMRVKGSEECQCNIDDYYKTIRAPMGCRQYYTEERGTFKSYSFDSIGEGSLPLAMDYAVCFNRPIDGCGMTVNAISFSLPASQTCSPGNVLIDDSVVGGEQVCCQQPTLGANYLGFQEDTGDERYFFCGGAFGDSSTVVSRNRGPLTMRLKTNENFWGASGNCPAEGCKGVFMNFIVNRGTC